MSYRKLPLPSKYSLFLALCMGAVFIFSCKKETVITSPGAKLAFSTDSVLFDTVFTTVGSTVRAFLVRNPNSQPIIISSIKLTGNGTNQFKINVDGTPGLTFSNIKIPAKDSIFVFVTVTINPTNANNPFVIEDSLVFTTNGNVQYVYLQAYGQNANFFRPNVFPKYGPAYFVLPCSYANWTPAKPYVIFGYLAVDSGCTLNIAAGTQIYFHNNGVLWVYKGASLQVNGASGNPVVFQGDRLEPEYKYVPGQWGEIWLSPGSVNNKISWAVIKNGTIGVEADTVASNYLGTPTLQIDHTIIKSMSQYGLLGVDSYITGNNDLIEDCQYFCLNLSYGGKYRFNQCTFANYWSYTQRQTPLMLLNNYYVDVNNQVQSRDMDSAFFNNCIIYGNYSPSEVTLDSQGSRKFNYYFSYCELATNTYTGANYTGCNNNNPNFKGTAEPPGDNYHVSDQYVGTNAYGVYPPDLGGNIVPSPPYMGAYQN